NPPTTATIQSFQLSAGTVSGAPGSSPLSGTITLSETPTSPVAILLTSSAPNLVTFVTAPDGLHPFVFGQGVGSVEVPAGSSQVTFHIPFFAASSPTVVNLTASLFGPNGNSTIAMVTVTP